MGGLAGFAALGRGWHPSCYRWQVVEAQGQLEGHSGGEHPIEDQEVRPMRLAGKLEGVHLEAEGHQPGSEDRWWAGP